MFIALANSKCVLHQQWLDISTRPANFCSFLLSGTLIFLRRKTCPETRVLGCGKHGHIHSLSDKESAKLRRQKIGYIYQAYKLLPILTAKENILLPATLYGRKIPASGVHVLADRLSIGNRLNHLPPQMSGGQRQRVAIARALINQLSILLADEPTGNLDKASTHEILEVLLKLNYEGNTILLVSHEKSFADMCPRKITLSDGRIISDVRR